MVHYTQLSISATHSWKHRGQHQSGFTSDTFLKRGQLGRPLSGLSLWLAESEVDCIEKLSHTTMNFEVASVFVCPSSEAAEEEADIACWVSAFIYILWAVWISVHDSITSLHLRLLVKLIAKVSSWRLARCWVSVTLVSCLNLLSWPSVHHPPMHQLHSSILGLTHYNILLYVVTRVCLGHIVSRLSLQ